MLKRPRRWLLVYAGIVASLGALYYFVPTSFLPEEDQGYIIAVVQAPPGATRERTDRAVEEAEAFFMEQPQVRQVISVLGFSFFGGGQNAAIMFMPLHPWDERKGPENSAQALAGRAMPALMGSEHAMIFTLSPPAIQALGNSSGFSLRLQDRTGRGYRELIDARNQLLGMASQSQVVVGVRPEGLEEAPQLRINVDRVQARALGISIPDIDNTLAISFGSAYANDFTLEGRVLRVLLQADAPQRMTPEHILALRVRNAQGQMVPFSSFTTVAWEAGPPQLERYNGFPSISISGVAAPGQSTGAGHGEMERLVGQLPEASASSGRLCPSRAAGCRPGAAPARHVAAGRLPCARRFVRKLVDPGCRAARRPARRLGALLFGLVRGMPMDVYFNIGIITIIGWPPRTPS
jgi:multidrug efflux pump